MPVVAEYRPVRAPRKHGEALIEPSWPLIGRVLDANRAALDAQAGHDIQGRTLRNLSRQARRELLAAARQYTAAYRDIPDVGSEDQPILLAGHQPQLFHAGVWFKNFVLSSLAAKHGAQAVNLLIDNDIHRLPSIRVPIGTRDNRRITAVSFDRTSEAIAYEERSILDTETFASFGQRVQETAGELLPDPLIRQLWPLAVSAAQRSKNLGRCLGEARHRLEAEWGQQTLELPLSQICHSTGFIHFAAHLLAHLPRFQEVYNSSLAEYRRVNRIRSRSHPVPDLAVDGSWLEAPFWIWTSDEPHRQHLFVRQSHGGLEMTDRRGLQFTLAMSADTDTDRATQQWITLENQGVKIRPRALITTMYARLVLADLFLHGIGGAKYDQLTDLIIQRFLDARPPAYLMVSATALLFEDRTPQLRQRVLDAKDLVRDIQFQPERHVPSSAETSRLIREKQAWIQRDVPRGQRAERHQAIERVNRDLQHYLPITADQAWTNLERDTAELRRETQFASREFSFCLFSESVLRPLLQELSR